MIPRIWSVCVFRMEHPLQQSAQSIAWITILGFGLLSVSDWANASNATLAPAPMITISPAVVDPKEEVPKIKPADITPPSGTLLDAPLSPNIRDMDASISVKLRELVATSVAKHITQSDDRSAVETFYRDRGFVPLWIEDGRPNMRAKVAMSFLRGVDADALDPADYPTPKFASNAAEIMAVDEITLTNSVLTFALQARTGRISYSRVSKNISYDLQLPSPAKILTEIAEASDVRQALDSFNPQQPGYKALKAKLANLRAQLRNESVGGRIVERPTMRRGTRLASNMQLSQSMIDVIIANMERWRWLPRNLGDAYVMVNIADYSLRVVDHEKTVWTTRIVVGKWDRRKLHC
jgi:L,D-transpeptidase YcbB